MSGKSTANVVPMNDLGALADRIRECYDEVRYAVRTALEKALEVGDLLNDVCDGLPRGERVDFIDRTGMPRRTAYHYMKLADHRELIETEFATVANLTVRGAMKAIANANKADQSDDPDDGDADPRDVDDEIEAEAQELLNLYRSVSDDARSRFLDLAGLSETA